MSDNLSKFKKRRERIRFDLKKKSDGKVRLSVFRSNKFVYVQAIDDAKGHTVAFASSKDAKSKGSKPKISIEAAKSVGLDLGKKLSKLGCNDVYYDRGGYKYHGIVKALADGVREAGIKF